MRGRVQEVKVNEVVDTQGLQHQHDIAQVDSLNLGNRIVFQLMLVSPGGVESEALASSHPASSAGSLVGRRLADWGHYQGLHSCSSVVRVLFAEAWVDHIDDVVDGETGFGNVGGQNNFPSKLCLR